MPILKRCTFSLRAQSKLFARAHAKGKISTSDKPFLSILVRVIQCVCVSFFQIVYADISNNTENTKKSSI